MRLTADRLITRIHFGAMLLVVIVAIVFIWVVDLYQQRARLAEHAAEVESRIHLNGSYLQQAVATLRQDTLFLARTPEVTGIMRARLNGGIDPRDNDLKSSWVRRLQETLLAFSEAHPQYFQLRYIAVADGGRELVRVDRRGGKIVVVPQAELQRKGDRDYFRGAVALRAGEIYLSDFSLEREHGVIAKPPIPMLRAATPVSTSKGEVFGIVVINLAAVDILEALRGGLPPEVDAYVADRQGRYLAAPQPGLAFAFEFGDERRLHKDFPDLAKAMDTATSAHWPLRRVQVGESRRRIAAERVHYDPAVPGNFVLLAYSVPELAWRPRAWPKPGLLVTGLLAALLTVALVSLWLRRQLAPLSKLTKAAEAIAGGARDVKLPAGVGEIRALSKAFRHMLDKVAERERDYMHLNADLEARVRERTAQLRLAATVLENTSEGVMVVDVDGTIVSVNPAFTEITGYTAEEAIGQTPRILRSDHHDESFYRTMLQQLLYSGSWQGEIWNRRKNGEIYPEWMTINLISETDGVPASYVAVFADVTEQRRKDERIRHLAFHDALTGLPNRSLLFDRLKHALRKAERERHGVAVMFLDLDGFKGVNDGFGHEVGDRLLQGVAECLSALLRGTDTVARLGGDEFVILLEDLDQPEDAAAVARTLIAEMSSPLEIGKHLVQVGASVGIALYPDDSAQADELMKYADTAMYAAKLEGKGTYRFFRLDMTEQASRRLQLETEIRRAIDGDELELYYQPQFSLVIGEVCGFEALLHWHHPERGLVKPGEFIAMAEETGLIEAIGDWALDEGCRQLAVWQERGFDIVLAINVSAGEMHAGDLPNRIAARLREHGIRPNGLRIEIDESVLMADPEQHVAALSCLRELGVLVAIDHFGTGYSNLAYLSRLPIDLLKIDRSFVKRVVEDEEEGQVVRTIIDLARSLNLCVVAEGIETEAQAEFMRQAGCPVGQGFLFARPVPASAAETWLTKALSQT